MVINVEYKGYDLIFKLCTNNENYKERWNKLKDLCYSGEKINNVIALKLKDLSSFDIKPLDRVEGGFYMNSQINSDKDSKQIRFSEYIKKGDDINDIIMTINKNWKEEELDKIVKDLKRIYESYLI